jgi:type IV pilus assembly protein PilM
LFDNIASFDIGYSSVKLIIAKRGIRNFEILSASIEEYDLDLYATDSLSAINDAVQRIIERVDLSDSIVITTFPSDRVIFRNITFPFNEQSKISDTIKFEAEESIPYPVEMVSLAFQMLPPSDTGRPVILSALKKDFIKEKINNIKDYGFSLQFAGIEGNAHLRCYEYFNSVNDENILVIDLDIKNCN